MNKKSDKSEFKQIEDLLINADVGSSKCEDLILSRLKYKIETGTIKLNDIEKEERYMKNKFSRVATLTLVTLILGVSVTYASEGLSSIIAFFQVGNTEITQYGQDDNTKLVNNENDEMTIEFMQEGFKGKLFDKDGNEAVYGKNKDYYTADGKMITEMFVKDLPNGDHEFITSTEENDSSDEKKLSLDEVKKVANSDIKLPNYLPQGYVFKDATTSFEGAGVNAVYGNTSGDTIVILAATTKEAANGVVTTEEVTETFIDGKKVTLSGNGAFWELKGTTYQLYWNLEDSNVDEIHYMDMKEVSKIIESMK